MSDVQPKNEESSIHEKGLTALLKDGATTKGTLEFVNGYHSIRGVGAVFFIAVSTPSSQDDAIGLSMAISSFAGGHKSWRKASENQHRCLRA
jgi:UDP-glucose 6-dehydrogenase